MKSARDYQGWALHGNPAGVFPGKAAYPGIFSSLVKHRSTLCVMATGTGKTYVLSRVADDWTNGNVLCLAHRLELIDQMADTLEAELGYRPVVEQGERGSDADTLFGAGHILVGSIQSMITEKRRKKFAHHPFGLIIIDEAHRATSPSYVKLVDMYRELYPELRVLGVTATPNRTDGTALGLVFESVAFEMGIVEGIDRGWLVDIHQKFAVVENIDLSKIKLTKNEFGEMDFKMSELEEELSQAGPLHEMSRPILDMTADGRQAIIFAASVTHAHLWSAVLNSYREGCAAAVDGTMSKGNGGERTSTVRRFKSGELQFLLNFNICTEGFDAPKTSLCVMGRPTKSELVYAQMLGRITRPESGCVDGIGTPEGRKDAIAASNKPHATVVDFVGNSKMQVVTASDILGGNFDVNIRDAADEIIGARGSANVRDSLAKSRAMLLLEAEEQRRRPVRTAIQGTPLAYSLHDVDPFSPPPDLSAANTNRGGATDAQVAALVNLGVDRDKALGYSRKQAGAVMDSLRQKRCTVKQATTLRKFGCDPGEYNTQTASAKIDEIAANGWRCPA